MIDLSLCTDLKHFKSPPVAVRPQNAEAKGMRQKHSNLQKV